MSHTFWHAVSAILQPLFYIGENFLLENFTELTNTIALLFTVNDRGVRGALLQKTQLFAKYLPANAINQSVFEPMCSGFSDSSAALRELTLKSTRHLVDKLTQPNLDKLSRYLVRLQGDQEARIRTNTILFIGKLAPVLTETTRHKLLLPAFGRATKDPYSPCRLAALQTVSNAKEFFKPTAVASQVLPCVTPCLLDPTSKVRKEAFSVVESLMFVLRQESERLNSIPDPEEPKPASSAPSNGNRPSGPAAPAAAARAPVAPAPASGGYLSGLSSWMSTSTKPEAPAPQPAAPAAPRPPPAAPASVPATAISSLSVQDDGWDDDNDMGNDDSGWGDDDLDMGGAAPAPAPASLLAAADEVEFFKSFDSKSTVKSLRTPGSGKLVVPAAKKTVKPKPVVQKLAVDDDIDDGWDDF